MKANWATMSWRSTGIARRPWVGPLREYDLIKEVTIGFVVVAALTLGVTAILGSPDDPEVQRWSASRKPRPLLAEYLREAGPGQVLGVSSIKVLRANGLFAPDLTVRLQEQDARWPEGIFRWTLRWWRFLLATAVGCAPQPEEKAAGTPSGSTEKACPKGKLATRTSGRLTIATDEPAYEPWFKDDKPANGKGFESAVAYAVAKQLGYPKSAVVWQSVPFNKAFAPGEKTFDFDINQVSISAERKKAVDFSPGYYDVRQAVIALKGSKAAKATSLADLKGLKLGASKFL